MVVNTIGFSGKSAKEFFRILTSAGVQLLIDIRRSNNTLYSGFTRERDLPFFLKRVTDIHYIHEADFAPSLELLRSYQRRAKAKPRDPDAWAEFERCFLDEIERRPIIDTFQRIAEAYENVCFLCSESTPDKCHRRLLAEYIAAKGINGPIEIRHL